MAATIAATSCAGKGWDRSTSCKCKDCVGNSSSNSGPSACLSYSLSREQKTRGGGGGQGVWKSLQRQLLYKCAASAQAGSRSPWLKTTPSSARGEPQTLLQVKHKCTCVFTFHTYTPVRACTCTHTQTFSRLQSVHVFTHILMSILTNNNTHAHIHPHTVSDVTRTRHTIAVDPSSE
jgi:hypothetical protein